MFSKIIYFIKYHNAFSICFMIVFVSFSLSLAASPDLRENFISSQETIRSIDNSRIVSADLDNFDFKLQIKSVTEDEINYYIVYAYQTLAIKDYIWQELGEKTTLTVNKKTLDSKDLGLYAAEELGEVINYELSYLKEVQQIEKQKGLTPKIVSTEYAGLVGQFLEPKEKVFPGYEPVIQEITPEEKPTPSKITEETLPTPAPVQEKPTPQQPVQVIEKLANEEQIRQIVLEMLSQYREKSSSTSELSPVSAPAPTPTSAPEPTPEPSTLEPPTPELPAPELTPTSTPEIIESTSTPETPALEIIPETILAE